MKIALLRSLLAFCFQIKNKEIPKNIYRVVHTGPNNQLGGLNDGWFSVLYHPGIASAVNIPAIAPKLKGNAIDANSLRIWDIFIKICL
jgi:hypothetical protein